jgi:AcrR family transcriptional regulator
LSSVRDARAARTANALRRALLELLEHKAWDEITVRDITSMADISYATFFRHYSTKEALLNEVASDQMRSLVQLTLPIFDAFAIDAAILALFAHVDENRVLWTALLTGGAANAMREEQLRLSQKVAAGRIGDDGRIPVKLGVSCTASVIFETLVWWLDQPHERYTIRQAADILISLIGKGTATDLP